jgi:hypothetical protein
VARTTTILDDEAVHCGGYAAEERAHTDQPSRGPDSGHCPHQRIARRPRLPVPQTRFTVLLAGNVCLFHGHDDGAL